MKNIIDKHINEFNNTLLICFEENPEKSIFICDKNYKYSIGDKIIVNTGATNSSLKLITQTNELEENLVATISYTELNYLFSKKSERNKSNKILHDPDSGRLYESLNSGIEKRVYGTGNQPPELKISSKEYYNCINKDNNSQSQETNGINDSNNMNTSNNISYNDPECDFNCIFEVDSCSWKFTNKINPEYKMVVLNEHLTLSVFYLEKDKVIDSLSYNPFENNFWNTDKVNNHK